MKVPSRKKLELKYINPAKSLPPLSALSLCGLYCFHEGDSLHSSSLVFLKKVLICKGFIFVFSIQVSLNILYGFIYSQSSKFGDSQVG